jgi:hypothetical protein
MALSRGARLFQVNATLCGMLGYSEAELLASDWQALTHLDDRDVTFFERPASMLPDAAFQAAVSGSLHLFSKSLAKSRYLCDVHFVDLGQPPTHVVGQTRYWSGLFSRQYACPGVHGVRRYVAPSVRLAMRAT